MAAEENDNEPVKLTDKLQSEITEQEPIGYTDLKPEEPVVESEDEEGRFEETMESTDTAKAQERKPEREEVRLSKVKRKSHRNESEGKPMSQLQSELRKHSDARKKTDLAVRDIQKELKDLLLIHHATIKDLQKQVTQMHRKIASIDSSKKSTRSKTTGKKTARNKKTPSSRKSKLKKSQKKSRKR
jgi:hypothetical protein